MNEELTGFMEFNSELQLNVSLSAHYFTFLGHSHWIHSIIFLEKRVQRGILQTLISSK